MASAEPARSPKRIPSSRPPTLEELAAKLNKPLGPISSTSNSRQNILASLRSRTNPSSTTSPGGAATSPDSASGQQPPSIDVLVDGTAAVSLEDDKKKAAGDEAASTNSQLKDKAAPRGYKNIPSLDAIAGRLARSRTETASSTTAPSDKEASGAAMAKASTAPDAAAPAAAAGAKSPELEDGEIDEDQAAQGGSESHPLQHTWTLFHDSKTRLQPPTGGDPHAGGPTSPYVHPPNTASGEYEAGLQRVGEFNTVEDFCRLFNWLKPPSQLEKNSNYHLFKDGIKPMWEDPANAQGGKWVLTMRSNPELVDRCWTWLTMALVGEELDERDEVCGAVVSLRAKIDRIQLWLRTKDDIERINSIGKKLVKLLDLGGESGIGLEFQYNTDDRPTHTKFISIVPANQSGSFFRSRGPNPNAGPMSASADGSDAPPVSAPGFGGFGGGGMGSFSTGGGSNWRGKGGFQGGALGGGGGKSSSAFLSHNRSTSASGSANGGATNTTQG